MDRDPLREVYPDIPPRTHYAALDQLAPGDRIWLDRWEIVARTERRKGDEYLVVCHSDRDFAAPAALLVRRTER
jgi:hypothetical protein